MTTFADLELNPKILKAITEAGYETPTPIQAGAIPAALKGKDVLGIAQTGTGKTASFTLPMIHMLARGRARAHAALLGCARPVNWRPKLPKTLTPIPNI